jgi:hypothetical protein
MTQNKCRMHNAACGMQRLLFCSAFCIVHSALIFVSPCSAQMPRHSPHGGQSYELRTDAFRRLLFELRFQPLRTFAELQANPGESLFILLGNPNCLSKGYFPEGLRSFVEQGGAVLIATDMKTQGEEGENLSKLAGVTVTGETLVVRQVIRRRYFHYSSQHFLYNNQGFCPFVEPIEYTNPFGTMAPLLSMGSRPELFRRFGQSEQPLDKVATNAPSRLVRSGRWLPSGIYPLAKLPMICQDEKIDLDPSDDAGGLRFVDEKGPLFAVGGTVGKGRALVLADHSIFINRMILPRDNDNLPFTTNCLHWLRGGVSTPLEALQAARSDAQLGNGMNNLDQLVGQRNKVLFWDDGRIQDNFEVPLKRMPATPSLPSESAIVAAIDKTIAKLEDSDALNRAILERIDNLPGGRDRVIRSAVVLLTWAALLFLGYRFLWRTRYRTELAVPLLSNAIREHEPNVSLLDQRRRALLRLGNVWEMGHRLARECFESFGVSLTSATPPRVLRAPGSRWQRWRLNRRVARLWRLARGDEPTPLSPIALKHRLRELEELKTALANGTIVLNAECKINHG